MTWQGLPALGEAHPLENRPPCRFVKPIGLSFWRPGSGTDTEVGSPADGLREPIWRSVLRVVVLGLCFVALSGFGEEPPPKKKFAIPQAEHQLVFPCDHGSHPDFKIEWWYITGHLFAKKTDRRFGFQATFFRLGQEDGSQVFMAHMAVSDPKTKRFFHEELLNREGWNACAERGVLDLRNGNWALSWADSEALKLHGSVLAEASFALDLMPDQPQVIFGEDGVSKKGEAESAASYYITFPRLSVSGNLRLDGEDIAVTGEAWMDHEISSSQLDRNQVGWDWIQIQFDDGRELMGYILREENGKPSRFSSLNWIDENGKVTIQRPDDFDWEPGGFWKSEATGARYPTAPTIRATDPKTGKRVVLKNRPTMAEQEMIGKIGGVSYWEGAGDVVDENGKVLGRSFLELTGYVGDLGEKLR